MKKRLYYLLCGIGGIMAMLLVLLPVYTIAKTSPLEINIVSGNETGEYYSLARDLEDLASKNNLDIDVIPTRGALQNIHDVFYYESVPIGITQSDVLAFLNTFANNDEEARRQAESLVVVSPLYPEEVHLIARQDINSVAELAGKRVSIGDSGSGTSTTASNLLYQLGISPKELLTFDIKRGIDALRKQEIDAIFYVVGIPATVLEEEISSEDNFHLLALALPKKPNDEFLTELYTEATLPAATYTWQREPVETLAVTSLLFTVATQNCENVTPVAKLIGDNLSWLKNNGDSVWEGVNLTVQSQLISKRLSSCASF